MASECDDGDTDPFTVLPGCETPVNCGPTWATSWEDSETFCQSIGGHLVSIDRQMENLHVAELVNQNIANLCEAGSPTEQTRAWIGLNDRAIENNQVWSDRTAAPGFSAWQSTQPDDTDSGYAAGGASIWVDCVAIEGSQTPPGDYGTWSDWFCPRGWPDQDPDPQTYLPFVCEVDPCALDCDYAYDEGDSDYPIGPTIGLNNNNE